LVNLQAKIAKLVGILNIVLYGLVILVTMLAFRGSLRLLIIGCMCAVLTVGMYAAPMAAMVGFILSLEGKKVTKTIKSFHFS